MAVATIEKPILFSGEMVRAILDGRKTQTRRIVKGSEDCEGMDRLRDRKGVFYRGWWSSGRATQSIDFVPKVQPGETLWVREPATLVADYRGTGYASGVVPDRVKVRYEADGKVSDWIEYPTRLATLEVGHRIANGCYREACRLRLNVTGVRVERLQEITRGDAMAEGCPFPNMRKGPDPREWFANLWRKINGPESWAANPWVWVYEFERKDDK